MSKLLASTLGIFVPKFKTIAQYAVVQLLGHMDSKMTATYLGRRSREERAWRFVSTNQ